MPAPEWIPKEYRCDRAGKPAPQGALELEWIGTASFRITFSGHVLLIDPFVTRTGMLPLLLTRLKCNEALSREVYPKADDILLGHSHYDHLLDVPAISLHTGAVVHGSKSTAEVCRAAGIADGKTRTVNTGKPFPVGPHRITFVPSLHGKAFLGRVPCPGEISDNPSLPMKFKEYRNGGTFGLLVETSGFRMLHMGSADLIDEELIKVGSVDVLMLGLAGRKGTPDFVKRTAARLSPAFIIPHHYDNFFRPLRKPLKPLTSIHLDMFYEEVRQQCPNAKVLMPGLFEKVCFDPGKKTLL
jgi:L-ascorbate metabolism protein UlaG (beta-lactamase superfamily)